MYVRAERRRRRLALPCLVAGALGLAGAVIAAEEALLLEATVNGLETRQIVTVHRNGTDLRIGRADLQATGVRLYPQDEERILLGAIANTVSIDHVGQRLLMTVPLERLARTSLQFDGFVREKVPLAPAPPSVLMNYDMVATATRGAHVLSGFFEGRWSGSAGVLSSTALGYAGATDARSVRLDTQYAYSDPQSLRRFRIGDFIGGGLSWTRPVRIGGLQLSTDFNLRPDLVTFPTPDFFGEATVPSTVDLFINGVRHLSQPVPPGAFEIRQAPVPTGAGAIAIAVTDALGRQTLQTLPFYITDRLLTQGLTSFALDAGFLRQDYGRESNNYRGAAVAATLRHGVRDDLTLETHAEATRGLLQAGAGAVIGVGALGSLALSLSHSLSRVERNAPSGSPPTGNAGTQISVGFERSSRVLSLSLSRQLATHAYADLGAVGGSPIARAGTNLTLSAAMGDFGSANLAFSSYRAPGATLRGTLGQQNVAPNQPLSVRVLSASYFKTLAASVNLAVTAFRNFNGTGSGMSVSLLLPFDKNRSAVIGSSVYGSQRTVNVQATQPTVSPGDIGWQVQVTSGTYTQRMAQVDYNGLHGRGMLAASSDGHVTSERAGLRGALVAMPQGVFAANWINDSFALVDTGRMPDVDVYVDNRLVGRTESDGKLLVSELRSYDVSRISVNIVDLPLEARVEAPEQTVKPRDRSASLVDMRVRLGHPARIALLDRYGKPVPVGSTVGFEGSSEKAPVGYDGETYFPDISSGVRLELTFPSGEKCSTLIRYDYVPNTIPLLYPLPCQ